MLRTLIFALALAVGANAGTLLTLPDTVEYPQITRMEPGSINPILVWVVYPDVGVLGDFSIDTPGMFGYLGYFDIWFAAPNEIRFQNARAEQPLTLTLVGLFVDPFRPETGDLLGKTVFRSALASPELPGAPSALGASLLRDGVPTGVYGEASLCLEQYAGGLIGIQADVEHSGRSAAWKRV